MTVVSGVAVVEDQYDKTALIKGTRPECLLDREAELLEAIYKLMPTIPFDEVDVLVLDCQDMSRHGSIQTSSIDNCLRPTNPELPDIKLSSADSPKRPRNAMSMESSDFVHSDSSDELNSDGTLINAITASTIRGILLPPVVETDHAELIASLLRIGVVDPDEVRVP